MTRVQSVVQTIQADITGKDILEVACGCAEFSCCASKAAASVHCIDLDAFRLREEIQRCSNVTFEIMDATAMAYQEQSFDTVVIYNAIGRLSEIIEPILRECRRVARQDGAIYIISSFKMDKNIITTKLIPFLEEKNIPFTQKEDKYFTYVKL